MSDIETLYDQWHSNVDEATKAELEAIHENPEQLKDAFYRELSFGTAGLRGILGAGPNRMNVYTVGKATQGFANYLVAHYENPSVAVARDSRNMGEEFVKTVASVMAANGVKAYVYDEIQPTPALSFAVRDLGCSGGINITASHNPAAYNGYKAYGEDGCQIASEAAAEIQASIDSLDFFDSIKRVDFDEALEQGTIEWISQQTIDNFIDAVAAQSVEGEDANKDVNLKVVYTPLNGTGLKTVLAILKRFGITDVTVVPEQEMPDGNFPTCPYPNPEIREALQKGLDLCDEVKPDILLATDPDADRVGIAVPHDGQYYLLTGNEVGVLLLDYICSMCEQRGESLSDKFAVTTIVSSLMPDAQAADYGFEMRRSLTGFKYIGGQIALVEEADQVDRFMFGFEESYGYLSGPHVRDKDAINASMLICQMARWHKSKGKDLYEAMEALYAKYGYYLNRTLNVSYPGSEGADRMTAIMDGLRTAAPAELAGYEVKEFIDFKPGVEMPRVNGEAGEKQMLPGANVVSFGLDDGVKVLIRPSGTEPKIKAYLFAKGETRADAEALLDKLEVAAKALLD